MTQKIGMAIVRPRKRGSILPVDVCVCVCVCVCVREERNRHTERERESESVCNNNNIIHILQPVLKYMYMYEYLIRVK